MAQVRVGTRELKNKLSQYLRRVKAGETVVVTEHGKPIGQIVPFQEEPAERLKILSSAGLVEWNGQSVPAYLPQAINRSDKTLADLVSEQRE